jgi:hypothetical protein
MHIVVFYYNHGRHKKEQEVGLWNNVKHHVKGPPILSYLSCTANDNDTRAMGGIIYSFRPKKNVILEILGQIIKEVK